MIKMFSVSRQLRNSGLFSCLLAQSAIATKPSYCYRLSSTMAGLKKRPRDNGDVAPATASKKAKNAPAEVEPADDSSAGWEIGNKRRVTVSMFNNQPLVNIREYYEKDDKLLPSKKGISLTPIQWRSLLEVVKEVNDSLREHGIVLPGDDVIPYDADEAAIKAEDSGKPPANKSTSKQAKKANIEATSEEDNDKERPEDEA